VTGTQLLVELQDGKKKKSPEGNKLIYKNYVWLLRNQNVEWRQYV